MFNFQVLDRHVREAYNLLNKSIIRVEQPDINLDDDEDDNLVTVDEASRTEGNIVSYEN